MPPKEGKPRIDAAAAAAASLTVGSAVPPSPRPDWVDQVPTRTFGPKDRWRIRHGTTGKWLNPPRSTGVDFTVLAYAETRDIILVPIKPEGRLVLHVFQGSATSRKGEKHALIDASASGLGWRNAHGMTGKGKGRQTPGIIFKRLKTKRQRSIFTNHFMVNALVDDKQHKRTDPVSSARKLQNNDALVRLGRILQWVEPDVIVVYGAIAAAFVHFSLFTPKYSNGEGKIIEVPVGVQGQLGTFASEALEASDDSGTVLTLQPVFKGRLVFTDHPSRCSDVDRVLRALEKASKMVVEAVDVDRVIKGLNDVELKRSDEDEDVDDDEEDEDDDDEEGDDDEEDEDDDNEEDDDEEQHEDDDDEEEEDDDEEDGDDEEE